MPKYLSRHLVTTLFCSLLLLSGCGQKGPLYLEKNAPRPEEKGLFTPKSADKIITNITTLQPLNIGGEHVSLNQIQQPGWTALFDNANGSKNQVRYFIFNGDVLGEQTPITVLNGYVQGSAPKNQQKQRIPAGNYLHVRSADNTLPHMPSFLSAVQHYLSANDTIKRTRQADFIIKKNNIIDLYLSVETP